MDKKFTKKLKRMAWGVVLAASLAVRADITQRHIRKRVPRIQHVNPNLPYVCRFIDKETGELIGDLDCGHRFAEDLLDDPIVASV